jgi:hypothetical protein
VNVLNAIRRQSTPRPLADLRSPALAASGWPIGTFVTPGRHKRALKRFGVFSHGSIRPSLAQLALGLGALEFADQRIDWRSWIATI